MAEERDDMEFNDPLEGLDLGLLSFDAEGKKMTDDSGSTTTGTNFDVRDVDNKDLQENIVDDKGEKEEDTDETSLNLEDKNTISVRDTEGDETGDNTGDTDSDISDADTMWSGFANVGIIELEDGELEDTEVTRDLEWFASKTQSKIDKGITDAVEEYKDTLPEEVKYLLDNYEAGVSILDLVKADKAVIEYENIKEDSLEDNDSMQKELLSSFYRLQGEEESDIKDLVSDAEAAGLLEKQSKRALKKLSTYQRTQRQGLIEKQKADEVEAKKAYNNRITSIKENIDKKDVIIPGVEFNDKQKKQLFEGITKFDRNGKNEVMRFRESNPDFDLVVAYLATAMNKGGKINWDKLTTIAETQATKNLKEKANKTNKGGSTKRNNTLKGVDLSVMRNALKF